MSDVLQPEKQTAWQRWELNSFGDHRPSVRAAAERDQRSAADAVQQQKAAQDLNLAIQQAREQGRLAGYAAGLEQGRDDGHAQGWRQAHQERAQMAQLLQGLQQERVRAHETMADDLLTLALDIAKAVIRSALQIRPELILPLVSQALRELPSVQQPAQLSLHPADAQLLREQQLDELVIDGWRIREDESIERGGCQIETALNHLDASLPMRWKKIAAALGRDDKWMA